MKRILKYTLFSMLFTFIFTFSVNAECSYQERKDLLNATKNVEIFYDIETKQKEVYVDSDVNNTVVTETRDVNYIVIKVTNVTDDFFIKVTNELNDNVDYISKDDLKDGLYVIEQEFIGRIFKYNFEFFSKNNNCLGYSITKRSITLPIYNEIAGYEICENEKVSSSKYCKKYITKEFNKSSIQIEKELESIINNNEEIESNEKTNGVVEVKYIVFGSIFLVVIIIVIIVVFEVKKRRNRL